VKRWRHKYDYRSRHEIDLHNREYITVKTPKWCPERYWKLHAVLWLSWRLAFDFVRLEYYSEEVNCHGFALDLDKWFQPGKDCWPISVQSFKLNNWLRALRRIGFVPVCNQSESDIALFVDAHGYVKHTAKKMTNGRWASKLGASTILITNHRLNSLAGSIYGYPQVFLKRVTPNRSGPVDQHAINPPAPLAVSTQP